MNSARISVGGNRRAEDSASAENEDESSSSSSSSPQLSSTESSPVNSDGETEAPEADAVKKSTEQPSVKSKSNASSSASKSDEQQSVKKSPNMTEEADDRKSKPPVFETLSQNSSTVANFKSDELPNLSAKKSAIKKPTEKIEETKVENQGEWLEKVKTKFDELSNLGVKLAAAKKSLEVERESSNELSEKSSKFSGISKKIDKDLSAGEAVKDNAKEKDLKETPETPSKDPSDRNSKGTPGKISKLSSGWLKKFENPTEKKDGREVSGKNSSEKLPGVALRKTSAGGKGDETKTTKEEEFSSAALLRSEKVLVTDVGASNEQSADSEKVLKVPKLKRSGDKNPADKESSADSSAVTAKSSCDVKKKINKEKTNHDNADTSTEKIAKEPGILSAEDISEETRHDIGLTPEITSNKEVAKKRRKSPANVVRETAEREEEKETDKSAAVYLEKPSTEDGTVKLTVGNDQDTPAKTKRGKSSKTPSAAADGILSINAEASCTNPREVKPTEFASVEENRAITGEAVAKETERREHGRVVEVDGNIVSPEKTINVAIKMSSDERESSIKDVNSEVLAKTTTTEKPTEEPDIAAHRRTDGKPRICQMNEDVPSEATEDAGAVTTKDEKEREETEEEEGEVPVLNRSESVDDFIQKILSEVRGPDWRLKESEQEQQETRLLEPTDGEPKRETKREENKTEARPQPPPANNKSVESREGPKQRSTKLPVDEGEKQAIIAKYLRKKERQSSSDFQDLNTSKKKLAGHRAINAEEVLRRERPNQNHEFESSHAPYATTLAGPKVSRGKLKRFNFGDENFREKGEEISKFRQERLPEEAFRPQRSEGTSAIVRQKSRGVRTLVENQSEVIDAVKKASSGLDELEQEIDSVKQLSLGYRRRVEELERAFDAETKAYETEYRTATENCRQRSVQPKSQKKKKKEDFLDLMFDPVPAVFDAEFEAFSTPAVASFLNRYGSGETSNRGPTVTSSAADQPLLQDFSSETSVKFSSKVDEYLFTPERRNGTHDRMENGREFEATANISRLIPSVSDARVEISSLDEFLNRVESKYSTFSPTSSVAEPTRSLKLADIATTTPSFSGFPKDTRRSSRQLTRAAADSGYFTGESLISDRVLPWTEKGFSHQSANFGNELGGHLSSNAKSSRSKGETESYTIRSISIGPRSRRK